MGGTNAAIQDIGAFNAVRESGLASSCGYSAPDRGNGTCGRGNGAEEVFHALNEAFNAAAD